MPTLSDHVDQENSVQESPPPSPLLVDSSTVDALFAPLTSNDVERRLAALNALAGTPVVSTEAATVDIVTELDEERVAQIVEGHSPQEQR
ncbi:hypothetical protein EON83_25890 [bacterium]|nr:MAG: hypothetical protein EON83_25890 [bacterium]